MAAFFILTKGKNSLFHGTGYESRKYPQLWVTDVRDGIMDIKETEELNN